MARQKNENQEQAPAEDVTSDDTLNREADQVQSNTEGPSSGAPVEGGVTTHQEGAPAETIKAVEEAEKVGYLGDSPEKPNYSQSNPDVMNGGK